MAIFLKKEWFKIWNKKLNKFLIILLFLIPILLSIGGKTMYGQLIGCPSNANVLLQSLGSISVPYHILIALIVGPIVSEEYKIMKHTKSTFSHKFRFKLLLSKYLVSLLLNLLCSFGLWIDLLVSGNFILGFQSPFMNVPGSSHVSVLLTSLGLMFGIFVSNILIISGTFLISTVFIWPLISIIISILMLVVDNFCSVIASIYINAKNILWLKWNPFNVFNINLICGMKFMGIPLSKVDLNYLQMIMICILYSLFCFLLSNLIFQFRTFRSLNNKENKFNLFY